MFNLKNLTTKGIGCFSLWKRVISLYKLLFVPTTKSWDNVKANLKPPLMDDKVFGVYLFFGQELCPRFPNRESCPRHKVFELVQFTIKMDKHDFYTILMVYLWIWSPSTLNQSTHATPILWFSILHYSESKGLQLELNLSRFVTKRYRYKFLQVQIDISYRTLFLNNNIYFRVVLKKSTILQFRLANICVNIAPLPAESMVYFCLFGINRNTFK